jgi:hypothetical protein
MPLFCANGDVQQLAMKLSTLLLDKELGHWPKLPPAFWEMRPYEQVQAVHVLDDRGSLVDGVLGDHVHDAGAAQAHRRRPAIIVAHAGAARILCPTGPPVDTLGV